MASAISLQRNIDLETRFVIKPVTLATPTRHCAGISGARPVLARNFTLEAPYNAPLSPRTSPIGEQRMNLLSLSTGHAPGPWQMRGPSFPHFYAVDLGKNLPGAEGLARIDLRILGKAATKWLHLEGIQQENAQWHRKPAKDH